MKPQAFCPDFFPILIAVTLANGLLACGKDGATDASTRGGAGGGGGGMSTATDGSAVGAGGTTMGTGGGVMSTGGVASGTGGAGANTGGSPSSSSPPGTGGLTVGGGGAAGAGTTGGDSDAGTNDGPASQDDVLLRQDLPSDRQQDGHPDSGAAPNDAQPVDSGPSRDSGIVVPSGYKLVWSDEFDVDGTPNPKNWTYEKGFVRNEELQWYQSANATVKGGLLVIEARKERVPNPNYQSGSSDWKTSRQYAEYTSTSMTTSGLQGWQYGRFEMRARIPTNAGMWPAWWTLGLSGEWPSNGEIDIMEYYKGNVLANVACGTATRWQAKWDSSTKAISSLGSGWASDFHVWRMDWDDQKIDLYLDDNLMNSVTLSSMLNSDGSSPFKQKVTMLVNLAIGGANGGDPGGTTFPQKYEVDWIRVFQKQ